MKKIIKIFFLSFPFFHKLLFKINSWKSGNPVQYPRPLGNELAAVADVLYSAGWNMSYGSSLPHNRFEREFANYIGTNYAVAVNSGGMAIQMLLRALSIKSGDEIVHQADTCVANPFSVINAFVNPVFADISPETFMLSKQSLESAITPRTKAIMPIHMWGYPENLDMVMDVSIKNNLFIIEDSCLSLGTEYKDRKTGAYGTAGVFSFGCMKPLETGEGGMITTNDESVAKELKAMRAWGDRSFEFGSRDQKQLSWNGRASEIVMAVASEQFKKYPALVKTVQENVEWFREQIKNIEEIKMKSVNYGDCKPTYTQVVFEINNLTNINKGVFFSAMKSAQVQINHANFEVLTSLSFFKNNTWKDWNVKGNTEYLEKNYSTEFPNAHHVYEKSGFGINRSHFESRASAKKLILTLESYLSKIRKK